MARRFRSLFHIPELLVSARWLPRNSIMRRSLQIVPKTHPVSGRVTGNNEAEQSQ